MGELEGGDRAGMEALPAGLDKQQGKGQGGKEEARPGAGGDAGADLDAACHQALGAAGSAAVQGRLRGSGGRHDPKGAGGRCGACPAAEGGGVRHSGIPPPLRAH